MRKDGRFSCPVWDHSYHTVPPWTLLGGFLRAALQGGHPCARGAPQLPGRPFCPIAVVAAAATAMMAMMGHEGREKGRPRETEAAGTTPSWMALPIGYIL